MASGQVHDPQEMFRHAEHIYNGYGIVAERYKASAVIATIRKDERVLGLFVPMSILSAFATEVYLKCLLVIDAIAIPRTHKLRELFDALPESTRMEIRARFDADAKGDAVLEKIRLEHNRPTDFDSCLDQSSNAFERIRYLYERPLTNSEGCFLRLIMKALRETILGRNPTWKV